MLLGFVGHDRRRDVHLYVTERQVGRIAIGQTIELLLPDAPSGSINGRVNQVAATATETVPASLIQTGLIPASTTSSLAKAWYRVDATLDPNGNGLTVGRLGIARVSVSPQSLWGRISSWIDESLR